MSRSRNTHAIVVPFSTFVLCLFLFVFLVLVSCSGSSFFDSSFLQRLLLLLVLPSPALFFCLRAHPLRAITAAATRTPDDEMKRTLKITKTHASNNGKNKRQVLTSTISPRNARNARNENARNDTHEAAKQRQHDVGRRIRRVQQAELVLEGARRDGPRHEARAQLVVQRRRVVVAVVGAEEHDAAEEERGPAQSRRRRMRQSARGMGHRSLVY